MTRYTATDVGQAVASLVPAARRVALVHASLPHLGQPDGTAPRLMPVAAAASVLAALGPDRTVVVPAFTFSFCNGHPFDRQHSPVEGMGVFAETVRRWAGARRSRHPMQSLAAVGPLAPAICDDVPVTAFSEGSAFDRLLSLDAHLVLLGVTFQAASVVHLAEERARVPYRYLKDFRGPYRDGGEESLRTYSMFVRDLQRDPRLNLTPVERALRDCGALQAVTVGAGWAWGCALRDVVAVTASLLAVDPEALVRT